jgi:hypothetical protein
MSEVVCSSDSDASYDIIIIIDSCYISAYNGDRNHCTMRINEHAGPSSVRLCAEAVAF